MKIMSNAPFCKRFFRHDNISQQVYRIHFISNLYKLNPDLVQEYFSESYFFSRKLLFSIPYIFAT